MRIPSLAPALACLLGMTLLVTGSARAADRVQGVMVVNGTTIRLTNVYVTLDHDADDEDETYQSILLSDRPVAVADRGAPARLKTLAEAKQLHAVRILWHVGYDGVLAAPYDASLRENGLAVEEHPTIDFRAMDEKRLEARIRSKMLGQIWHYDATISAAIVPGGALQREPLDDAPSTSISPATNAPRGSEAWARALKVELGRRGYEFSDDHYAHAVAEGDQRAVEIFLELGKSPNAVVRNDPMLVYAASFCESDENDERTAVILALIGAGADVRAKNDIGATALLDAVQYDCDIAVVKALLARGADPNAKSVGGATARLMAEWMHRDEMLALLKAVR